LLSDLGLNEMSSTARIAGAIAHELNNPLQGILSLVSVLSRECSGNPTCDVKLEQIRSGLNRVARVVQAFSVTYENLPRPPDVTSVDRFASLLESAFTQGQLQSRIILDLPGDTTFHCMATELARLVADAFSLPSPSHRTLRVQMSENDGAVVVTCDREPSEMNSVEPWKVLNDEPTPSGLAVLIQEIARLAQGEAFFRFDTTALSGVRLLLRRNMN
jgi:signal transduction histidine kinase